MSQITILGMREDRDRVLDALMRLGAVEIIDDRPDDHVGEYGATFADNMTMRTRLERMIADLRERFPDDSKHSKKNIKISEEDFHFTDEEEASVHDALNRYEALVESEDMHRNEIAALEQQVDLLQPWHDIPIDLSVHGTDTTTILYGTFRDAAALGDFEDDMREHFPLAALYRLSDVDAMPAKVAIVTVDDQLPRVRTRLSTFDFTELPRSLPLVGTARASIEHLNDAADAERRQLDAIRDELATLAESTVRFMTYHDYLLVRSEKAKANEQFHELGYTFFLNAWIPTADVQNVGDALQAEFDIAYSAREADEDEEAPVKLKNNRFVRAFEVILEMYGAPSVHEADPTPVMAPFYMLLFGMMLSDVGYGAVLVAATAYMLFKKKVEGGLRAMSSMLFISGIASVIWGFVFGGFFGDLVTAVSMGKAHFPALWFNPMDDPVKLLVFSMLFGVIHLFFGLAIHIRNEARQGNLIGGLADSVTWYLIIPGLLLLLGGKALTNDPATLATIKSIGKWMALGGVAFALIFSGHGIKNPFKRLVKGLSNLYGITSYLSDILSYARILALVLATSVIATVVNMLGMLAGPTVGGYIMFAIIGLLGHALNLALSGLSAFVHASRLQYVEMFGKFFVGGGTFWDPFRRETKYVKIEEASPNEAPSN
jgi:V/A-type H+-transporting ATPase subunit I